MSNLLKKEDYWAIWIGFACLFAGLMVFYTNQPEEMSQHLVLEKTMQEETEKSPFKTIAWYDAFNKKQKIKGTSTNIGKWLKTFTGSKPSSWKGNPFDAIYSSETKLPPASFVKAKDEEKMKLGIAKTKEAIAQTANYKNENLNLAASLAISDWQSAKKKVSKLKKKATKPFKKIPSVLGMLLFFGLMFSVASSFMGVKFIDFFKGFTIVFGLGVLAYWIAGQANMKAIGFGYAAWAIVFGLLISNTVGTPNFVKPALATSLYIKTGLVFLGAEILFGKILAIGLPGIFVAWVVTPIVLVSTYWFGQKILKIESKSLNMVISADMSVCGVSAAVATAAASNASKEELTLAVGLSMIFTSVMMIVLPMVINAFGMPEVLGGAWIGGTIDATGAVVAAGAFLGDTALNVAATIKMIQNVLIGVIAFGVAVYFTTKVENGGNSKIGFSEIWKRFPRFILGFIGASILFSIIYEMLGDGKAYTIIDQGVISGFSKNLRGWLFCLAFASIGLSTNFKELKHHFKGGKPLILYIVGQSLNLLLTLLMSYLMFYKVFPNITAGI